MSLQPPVLFTVTHKVAHVVMNRPEAMNAMSRGMITQLRQALEQAQNDPNVSIIVLSGAGNNFCAGDDLKEAEQQEKTAQPGPPKAQAVPAGGVKGPEAAPAKGEPTSEPLDSL